jgi:hypothetical protein
MDMDRNGMYFLAGHLLSHQVRFCYLTTVVEEGICIQAKQETPVELRKSAELCLHHMLEQVAL